MDHIPVLLKETIQSLSLGSFLGEKIVVDATMGRGGHASQIIQLLGPSDTFIGFDAYEKNYLYSKEKLEKLCDQMDQPPKLHCIHANFSQLKNELSQRGIHSITHLYVDLGVSSIHLDDPESTFSFQNNTKLDMRFDPTIGTSANEIIHSYSFRDLALIFRKYGDESLAGKIANAIVQDREKAPFQTNKQLADMILRVSHSKKTVMRCFQALRIEANDEYGVLESLLGQTKELMTSGGRIVGISFHSGEDRILKHIFREWSRDQIDVITGQVSVPGDFVQISRKPTTPSEAELSENPRSRSAKLRTVEKR